MHSRPKAPVHIAIVMDGNGRWARKRLLPNAIGHKKGAEALENTIKSCARLGVRYLTVYALSTENLQRPPEEVSALMELFMDALQNKVSELKENNVRLRFIGDREQLANNLVKKMSQAESLTEACSGLTVCVAICYGARAEMVEAARKLAALVKNGEIQIEDITQASFEHNLYTRDIPQPDLFIRPGGEKRLSNYLLWQCAYTELFFTDTLWPDFNEVDLNNAIEDYKKRERRYGKLSAQ